MLILTEDLRIRNPRYTSKIQKNTDPADYKEITRPTGVPYAVHASFITSGAYGAGDCGSSCGHCCGSSCGGNCSGSCGGGGSCGNGTIGFGCADCGSGCSDCGGGASCGSNSINAVLSRDKKTE